MTILFQSHGGKGKPADAAAGIQSLAAPPAAGDIAVDEAADFGYLFPPSGDPAHYLPEDPQTVDALDTLGDEMIAAEADPEPGSEDSTLPPILTYWGQFLDHELTARTDRESSISDIGTAHPPALADKVEANLKNARTPRFDLDSVYGGVPVGPGVTADVVKVIAGMRHPTLRQKMRVGTADDQSDLPDGLDGHRDLPRYVQVQKSVRDASLAVAQASMTPEAFEKFRDSLDRRALIGDARNDENLIVAQFHLSFLRFHNRAVDFLAANDTGWPADFHSAQMLTRLHYQWLVVEGYLKRVCQPVVVQKVIDDRADHFFKFRAAFDARHNGARLGNALPLEFSVAGYRFGHSMVRAAYDHNKIFGRGSAPTQIIDRASFDLLFEFTGGGGLRGDNRLPQNWIIDWSRFIAVPANPIGDGLPEHAARKIDTELAPPLGVLKNEGNDAKPGDPAAEALAILLKQLARRNLRRGYNLRLPTGQALHAKLQQDGAVASAPITDVAAIVANKQSLSDHLKATGFDARTPLWFYILAEAQVGGGNSLGELGSYIVASTFVGVLLSDPDSALARGFHPGDSPLRAPDGGPIDSIEKWLRFALVLE